MDNLSTKRTTTLETDLGRLKLRYVTVSGGRARRKIAIKIAAIEAELKGRVCGK